MGDIQRLVEKGIELREIDPVLAKGILRASISHMLVGGSMDEDRSKGNRPVSKRVYRLQTVRSTLVRLEISPKSISRFLPAV